MTGDYPKIISSPALISMLRLKGDLHKETKGTPKSFERLLNEYTAILKNYKFEEYWELSICQVTKLQ